MSSSVASPKTTPVLVPKNLLSRLYYPNPVCLLTTVAQLAKAAPSDATPRPGYEGQSRGEASIEGAGSQAGLHCVAPVEGCAATCGVNLMTISWLTALNNHGQVYEAHENLN